MQIVPDRSDKRKLIPVVTGLPMLREATFADHPVVWRTECVGLRISEIETSDVDLHKHSLQRQGRSIYNGTGAIRCIIDGAGPFALRCLFRLGGGVKGACAAAASFPVEEHGHVGVDKFVVKSEKASAVWAYAVICFRLAFAIDLLLWRGLEPGKCFSHLPGLPFSGTIKL
jgi:hypothetical protein